MQTAKEWINDQQTGQARTLREKAKYLVSATLPADTPHPVIWIAVLKISRGLDEK